MAKRTALIVLVFIVAIAVVFTGCTSTRKPMNTPGQYGNTGMNTSYNNNRGNQGTNQGTNEDARYQNYPNFGDNLGVRNWANNNGTGMYGNNTGYNNGTGMYGNNTGYNTGTGMYGNNTGSNVGYYNTGNNLVNTNTTVRRADDLARSCEQVQGVRNATVVVTGTTAYVGIDMDKKVTTTNQSDIKRAVAQMVRTTDKGINTVYVSTEANFMDRLRNVGNGLRNGTPVSTFTTQLREMVQRITPTRW